MLVLSLWTRTSNSYVAQWEDVGRGERLVYVAGGLQLRGLRHVNGL